jgi:hypothetical protein
MPLLDIKPGYNEHILLAGWLLVPQAWPVSAVQAYTTWSSEGLDGLGWPPCQAWKLLYICWGGHVRPDHISFLAQQLRLW